MAELNLVQNQSRGDTAKNEAQQRILHVDIAGLQKFLSLLKDVQENSTKILKFYHDYLQEKTRKTTGLPYHMIKKFQHLKASLTAAGGTLKRQCRYLRTEISNREFEKANQQQFFKKTLVGYDQKRIWMKNYILRNEKRVQVVEEEVLKNVEYEKHMYTQFTNTIDLERLQHNFHPKLDILTSLATAVSHNIKLRSRISSRLKKDANVKSNPDKQQLSFKTQSKINIVRDTFTSSSFLYSFQTKAETMRQFLFQQLKKIISRKSRLTFDNKQLKLAIDKATQLFQQHTLESLIILDQYQTRGNKERITKTDYLIFLKDVYREVQQRIKLYGQYFQYTLFNSQHYPNAHKSRSARKNYEIQSARDKAKHRRENVSEFLDRNRQLRLLSDKKKESQMKILELQNLIESEPQKIFESEGGNIIIDQLEQGKQKQ